MSTKEPTTNPEDLKALKERMKLIADADPSQYHNEFSLKRFLRAFKTVDSAFQVNKKSAIIYYTHTYERKYQHHQIYIDTF